MMRKIAILALAIALGACASSEKASKAQNDESLRSNMGTATSSAAQQTRDGLADAAMSPLEDFNLRRDEIPVLLEGNTSPYDLPYEMSCSEIAGRIDALNTVLGPDWDTPAPDERLRTEKLADSAAAATLGAVASEARGFIPFRGVVRKATGAERHAKKYSRAFKIGAQRRAYLKGYGLARNCAFPARPDFTIRGDDFPDSIVFKGDTPDDMSSAQPVPTSRPVVTRRVTRRVTAPSGSTSSEPNATTN